MEQRKRTRTEAKVLSVVNIDKVTKPTTVKQAVPMTYKDYMLKEENLKSGKTSQLSSFQSSNLNNSQQMAKTAKNFVSAKDQKQSKPQKSTKVRKPSVKTNQKRKRSNSASQTRRATSQEIKKEIQTVYNNFISKLQNGQVEDDDSLLQESQELPDKQTKQYIMKVQQVQRKYERESIKEKQAREEQHRIDNLNALNNRFKSQMKDFQHQSQAARRQKEKEEKLKKKRIDEIVKVHQGNHATTEVIVKEVQEPTAAGQVQLTELRAWIEQQMKKENMFSLNSFATEGKIGENQKENHSIFDNTAPKLVSIDVKVNKLKSESADKVTNKSAKSSKSKSKDKTKISNSKSKTKENQKSDKKSESKEKKKHPLLKSELPGNKLLNDEEKAKLPASRKNRYGVFPDSTGNSEFDKAVDRQRGKFQGAQDKKKNAKSTVSHLIADQSQSEETERESNDQRDDSCDQVPVRQSSNQHVSQRREVFNKPATLKEEQANFKLPGILNVKNQADNDSKKQKERENQAALVIQRRVRGFFGRRAVVKQREKIYNQIDVEYGRFAREVKNGRDYDLKRYLKEKQSLRQKSGLPDKMEEIDEMIGESSSTNRARTNQNQNIFHQLFASKRTVDKDPLSLINVYAQRHHAIPDQVKPPRIGDRSRGRDKRRTRDPKHKSKTTTSESIIEEDYPEDFEDSVPKSNSGSTIEEDLPKSTSSTSFGQMKKDQLKAVQQRGLVPAVGAVGQPAKVQPKTQQTKRRIIKDSPIESVAEDIIDEVSNIKNEESSIQEDSIIMESGLTDSKKKISESIEEDSIIRDEYDSDNHAASDAIKKIEARNRMRFGLSNSKTDERSKEQIKKEHMVLRMGEEREQTALQRQRLLGDLLSEMKDYERAHINTAVIDRMEKVVVSSLAQKDQLIMAQRLSELEREKRHQEEINKIREEQIHMMSQIMLLGIGSGSSNLSDSQRQEVINNIKKIVEKPVQITQETVHVNYSIQKVQPTVEMSLHEELIQSSASKRVGQPKKMTYLQEFDQKKNKRKITESIEEDIDLRQNDFSNSKKQARDDEEDEITDEVPSVQEVVEQSIAEEIEQSSQSVSQSQSGIFRNNNFQDFKTEKLKKIKGDASNMHQLLSQIELEIVKERNQRELELKQRLKKKKITSRNYEQKVKELEKWVSSERKELQERKKLQNDFDVKDLIKGINSERQALVEKIGQSPSRSRQQSLHLQFGQIEEDSRDSDEVREAIRQSQKLKEGINSNDPEFKYLEKKRLAASSLLEEKEKAIKKGLMSKIASLEEGNADELMRKALDLDVQQEIGRRFEIAKKMIEDSGNQQESFRSNITGSYEKINKPKKNVKFAPSVNVKKVKENEKVNLEDDDSISESIQIAESISNSVRSASLADSRPKSQVQISGSAPMGSGTVQSEISSEYSEDFIESAELSVKNSKSKTTSKLQAKAKDLEESNGYSEKFDEDSISQSQSLPQRTTDLIGSAKKMESVQEESIDESIEEHSKETTSQQQTEKSMADVVESLPSEDVEVKTSGQSTDWQIQVKQIQSQQTSQAEDTYTEEASQQDIKESDSEDINKREEIDDLESCPDDIGKSQSDNEIFSKADKIAEELLKVFLDTYKADNKFDLSVRNKQPDEDEFKNKFPWTLDKEPEPKPKPAKIEPAIIKRPESPKRIKSERELADEKFTLEHEKKQKILEERQQEVKKYLQFLCKRVDLLKMITTINNPIVQDPIKVLKQIQAYEDDDSTIMQNEDSDTSKLQAQQILPYNFFCKVDREYTIMVRMQKQKLTASQAEDSDILTVSQEDDENIRNIHHYALFEALNDALDLERPYRTKGKPMPWSTNSRTFKQITSQDQAKKLLEKAKERVLIQDKTCAGTNQAPLPVVPAQTQDEQGEEIIPPLLSAGEEERRNMHRHQKLAQLMTEDIQENEAQWLDYEIQDTQTRFDLADMILHQLTGEIVSFLQERGK